MSRVITLTTDFGTSDGYVASMKGVILGINPQARIVDITHAIEPQSILQAAFILHTAWRYFPEGTVHLSRDRPRRGRPPQGNNPENSIRSLCHPRQRHAQLHTS